MKDTTSRVASTGEEGVKKVEEERPDVVLMDINLPGIDGTEALRQNSKQPPSSMRHHADGLCHRGKCHLRAQGRGF